MLASMIFSKGYATIKTFRVTEETLEKLASRMKLANKYIPIRSQNWPTNVSEA